MKNIFSFSQTVVAGFGLLMAFHATAAEPAALFNGKDLSGWTTADGKPATASASGWSVEDGALRRAGKAGDIFTAEEYGDFTLTWEWKIAAGGNSGVKYRVRSYPGKGPLGFEYQLLDDVKHSDAKVGPQRQTASLYDILPPDAAAKHLKAPGEWNTSKIVVSGTRIEHWLNGVKVLETDTASEEFKKARAASKFKDVKGFGENAKGRVMLQDHGDEVWFRNILLTPAEKP